MARHSPGTGLVNILALALVLLVVIPLLSAPYAGRDSRWKDGRPAWPAAPRAPRD